MTIEAQLAAIYDELDANDKAYLSPSASVAGSRKSSR